MRIYLKDDLAPEDNAMLQSLYSRSPASVTEHLKTLEKSDPGKFMDKFYVGYGHQSIADCGSTTLFIEGVSMLAAKVIQYNPLYRGQEASSRYQNFLKLHETPYYTPPPVKEALGLGQNYENTEYHQIMKEWYALYETVIETVAPRMREKHGIDKDDKEGMRAVRALTYDIAGCFLPIGTKTNLSWHTDLRQAVDNLVRMLQHPYAEIRQIAVALLNSLKEKYPNTFQIDPEDFPPPTNTYHDPYPAVAHLPMNNHKWDMPSSQRTLLPLCRRRKRCEMLPSWTDLYGTFTYRASIDFRSWRDIARHRGSVFMFPAIDAKSLSFPTPYFEALRSYLETHEVQLLVAKYLKLQTKAALLQTETLQVYATPMGVSVPLVMSMTLRQALYVAEIRSSRNVHFSLRPHAQRIGRYLEGLGYPTYTCMDPSEFSVSRGKQTIERKEE